MTLKTQDLHSRNSDTVQNEEPNPQPQLHPRTYIAGRKCQQKDRADGRVALEKLTLTHPIKRFPALHGTRRFITVITTSRRLPLFQATSVQSPPSCCSFKVHFNIIPHLRLGLPSGFLPTFPQNPAAPPAHLVLLYFLIRATLGEHHKRNIQHTRVYNNTTISLFDGTRLAVHSEP